MKVQTCKYLNDHQTACSLMIDDLVPVAISKDGITGPHNDWGYFMDEKQSLYHYFDKHLIQKYPEIKGTIFLPVDSHNQLPVNNGYEIKNRGFDEEFINFLHRIADRFEYAFHGIKHAWEDDRGKSVHEFRNIESKQLQEKIHELIAFEEKTNIYFKGGKFPGYNYNEHALRFLKDGNFNWWALDADMLNHVSTKNEMAWREDLNIVSVPTNVSGDIFKNYYWRNSARRTLANLIRFSKISHPMDYLMYLYKSRLPITIQEHFQNQTTKSTRQPINIYDDIWSLDQIFGLLRGLDIWYATCGEIADYYFNYINTNITRVDNNFFEINSDKPFRPINISIKTSVARLSDVDENLPLQGVKRNNEWVFNNLKCGKYIAL